MYIVQAQWNNCTEKNFRCSTVHHIVYSAIQVQPIGMVIVCTR